MDEVRRDADAATRKSGEAATGPFWFFLHVSASPRRRVLLPALAALLMVAAGCALKANRGGIPSQVQATVDEVSADIAGGRYDKIYSEAAEEWRQAATPEQSDATFKKLKDKLGNVKSRAYHSATEQDGTGGHSFIITYTTSFERAEGMETFTLVERDGRWLLARYFVNSDALK